jgi:beta-glucosidase-like glycosyl hydrolase
MSPHKYTSTPEDTVATTLKAGCDLECDNMYTQHLSAALNASKIGEADVRTVASCCAVLRTV